MDPAAGGIQKGRGADVNTLFVRVLRKAQQFSLFGGARQDPEQPGSRGGKYYRTETGHVKYGEKPAVLEGPKTQNERMWEAGAVSSFMQQGMDPKQATAAARRQRDEQDALAVQFEKEKKVDAVAVKLAEFEADIPMEVARAAHAFSSFVPERRGDQERQGYARTLLDDWETFSKYADTPEKKQILATAFEEYRRGYKERFIARLHAASRTASVMITGASNFPTERNRKRLNTEHKRLEELLDYRKHILSKIRRALQPELAPIKATDPEATKKLETKATGIEGLRDELKALNRAYRKVGKSKDPKVMAAIMEGASEEAKKLVLRYLGTPNPWWDDLVPSFAITNMTGQIRAAKQRTQAVEHETQAREKESTGLAEGPGWKATAEPDDDRIHLKFEKRTSREVYSMLRQYGWLWSPTRNLFVRNLNEAGRLAVTQTASRLKEMLPSA